VYRFLTTVKLLNLMRTKSKSNRIETNRTESKTRKNFLLLKVLELREIFERNRIETKSIESNRNEFRVRIKFESFTV